MQEFLGKWALGFVAEWGQVLVIIILALVAAASVSRYRYEKRKENRG